jgi:hypothetical protein
MDGVPVQGLDRVEVKQLASDGTMSVDAPLAESLPSGLPVDVELRQRSLTDAEVTELRALVRVEQKQMLWRSLGTFWGLAVVARFIDIWLRGKSQVGLSLAAFLCVRPSSVCRPCQRSCACETFVATCAAGSSSSRTSSTRTATKPQSRKRCVDPKWRGPSSASRPRGASSSRDSWPASLDFEIHCRHYVAAPTFGSRSRASPRKLNKLHTTRQAALVRASTFRAWSRSGHAMVPDRSPGRSRR